MKVSIDGLADAVTEMLKEYASLSDEALKKAVDSTAKDVCNDIKVRATGYGWKEYAGSWGVKKGAALAGQGKYSKVVYAKGRNASLTHLLEKGHQLRQGGRTRAYPHIAPAEQHAEKILDENLRRMLNA